MAIVRFFSLNFAFFEVTTMTPFSNNGTIRQEDIQSRNIARQRIAQAIAKEAQRTELLVDIVIDQVGKNRLNNKSVDNLWNDIQMDGQLKAIRLKADRNVSDYPGFSGWLNGQRIRIEHAQKMRLAESMNIRIYQRRFANTVGFRPAFA